MFVNWERVQPCSVTDASFFDSIVSLIVKTSTDLPPDVRAAMRLAMNEEPEGDARGAGAGDHRAEHRSGGGGRRRDLPGHRACRPSR